VEVPAARELDLAVQLASADIEFENHGCTSIRVLPGKDSLPVKVKGVVAPAAGLRAEVEVRATFFHGTRLCGSTRRLLKVAGQVAAGPGGVEIPPPAREPPAAVSLASGPSLTVTIQWQGGGRYLWSLVTDRTIDADLPPVLTEEQDLRADPSTFVGSLYAEVERRKAGEHLALMRGAGARLWRSTPRCFQEAYRALRKAVGDPRRLTIQLVTDEHQVPWELMMVPTGSGESFLATEHPVARWPVAQAGLLKPRLRAGGIAVVAPTYTGANVLPYAIQELRLLSAPPLSAVPVRPATRGGLRELLSGALDPGPIAVLHFAGHGTFTLDSGADANVLLEDGALAAMEVDVPETLLGARDGTLVFMNACQVGRTGALLGGMGGWADALIARRFRGVVAPLWSVNDDQAFEVTRAFYDRAVTRREPIAEALRAVRELYGPRSHTYLSYLFHGDVTARLG
jgi:hypothetical protein